MTKLCRALPVLVVCALASVGGIATARRAGHPARGERLAPQRLAVPTVAGSRKLALLVQNDAYPDADRPKTVDDDAATLAALLKRDGFEVALERNAGRTDLRDAIAAVLAKVSPGAVVLLYYKGIAIEAARLDYLVPIDASIWSEDDLRRDGVRLDRLIFDLDRRGARVKIAIVDAARPNPFERRFRMSSAGLAATGAPQGSLLIFAQALDRVAAPGNGAVSPFMKELVAQLDRAGDAETAFARTREGVAKVSGGRELPWVSSTLVEPFRFSRPGAEAERPSGPEPAAPVDPGKPAPAGPSAASTPHGPPAAAAPSPQAAAGHQGPPPTAAPQPGPAAAAQSKPVQSKPVPAKPVQSKPVQASAPEARPGSSFSDCAHCPEMMVVPAGRFEMGSGTTPFDRPVHEVTIARPFALSRAPVTTDEWALCVEDGGCGFRPKTDAAAGNPVVGVDWQDAARYAVWLAGKTGKPYRLPTEAEWEYAAHGGTTTAFAWGDAPGVGHANCLDCGGTHGSPEIEPVRSYPGNGFGLYGMAGNVAQWLQDCWKLTYRAAPRDGSATTAGSCEMRVVRGGSFETTAAYIRPTARFRYPADTRSPSLGFRLARDLP